MKRTDAPNFFYNILKKLELRVGKRLLAHCDGKMNWPKQGVYFFFEDGEIRHNGKLRVVRVGTHAVSAGSKTTLWDRLRAHRGSLSGKYAGGGNHRGSIFRLHVGTSLINKEEIKCSTWGIGLSGRKTNTL